MAANNIKGITIEFGGDTTKLDKALKDTAKATRDTGKELDYINKALQFDPKNTVLLAQKQEVLREAIGKTEDRIKALTAQKEALDRAFANGEASAEQVRIVERQLESAKNRLKEYNGQIDRVPSGLRKAAEVGKAVGPVIASAMTAAFAAVTAVVTALEKLTVDTASYADNILTASTVTGISTDRLQAYGYAAQLVDVSVDTLTATMRKNIGSMDAARKGTGDAADAYSRLGVTVTRWNGDLRDSEAVYWETINALGRMSDETERDAAAMAIFGKSAQELNPLITAGAERMNDLAEQAEAVGYVMDSESLQRFGELDDNLQLLKNNTEAASRAMGAVLLPALTDLSEQGARLISQFTQSVRDGDYKQAAVDLGDGLIDMILGAIDMLADHGADIINGAFDVLQRLFPRLIEEGIPALISAIADMIPAIIDNIVPLTATIIRSVLRALPDIIASLMKLIIQTAVSIVVSIAQFIAKGGIISIIKDLLSDLFTKSGDSVIDGLIKGIKGAASKLWQTIKDIGKAALDGFNRIFDIHSPSKKTGWMGKMLMEGLARGITANAEAPVEAMADAVGNMYDPLDATAGLTAIRRVELEVNAAQTAASAGLSGKLDAILAAVDRGQILTIDGSALVGATVGRMYTAINDRSILAARGAV